MSARQEAFVAAMAVLCKAHDVALNLDEYTNEAHFVTKDYPEGAGSFLMFSGRLCPAVDMIDDAAIEAKFHGSGILPNSLKYVTVLPANPELVHHVETAPHRLFWLSGDRQTFVSHGEHESAAAARAAVRAARAEMLANCGTDELRTAIHAGDFVVARVE